MNYLNPNKHLKVLFIHGLESGPHGKLRFTLKNKFIQEVKRRLYPNNLILIALKWQITVQSKVL